MANHQSEFIIVGCGMAGLMAARHLQTAGKAVILLDKGRGVGGRIATRRIGPGQADHGAQFFTAHQPEFQHLAAQWQADGLVYVWTYGWPSLNSLTNTTESRKHPRYAVHGGFNALAKHLAQPLTIHRQTTVSRINQHGQAWHLHTETGELFTANALLLTAPVPQSLALLKTGDISLPPAEQNDLEAVRYSRCLCGLFWLEGDLNLPDSGALKAPGAPITWIADNQRKGISPLARLITVHTAPDFSNHHWDDDPATVLADITTALKAYLKPQTKIRTAQYHRWGYAQAVETYPQRTLLTHAPLPLAFAGDAFGDAPRLEGAALSGLAAAEALLATMR